MDSISDMLITIKNAQAVNKESVDVPHTKFKMEIAKILQDNGFVGEFIKRGKKIKKNINIALKYDNDGKKRINDLLRVSKLSRRVYKQYVLLRPSMHRNGIFVVSTSKGLMTDKEARKSHLGGEVLFEIW